MMDNSEHKEMKEPPKIKLNISDAEPEATAPPSKPIAGTEAQSEKQSESSAASKPAEDRPSDTAKSEQKPAETEKDRPKIKLSLDALDEVKPPEEKPPEKKSGDTPATGQMPAKEDEKPKIKLGLGSLDEVKGPEPKTAAPTDAPAAKQAHIQPSEKHDDKPDTSPDEQKDKPPIKLSGKPEEESESAQAEDKPSAPPIKLTGKKSEDDEVEEGRRAKAKTDTSKIDLSEAHPPPKARPPKPAAEEESQDPAQAARKDAVTEDASKNKTIRLDQIEEESLDDLYQAALNATQRVILDEKQRKSETDRQQGVDESQALKQAEIAESSKKSTARLDLQEMLSDEDKKELLKQETMHITPEGVAQKPAGAAKKSQADEPERKSSSTIPIPSDFSEPGKSETARIDLPREVASSTPPTQRKTIRIKRPDSGAPGAARPSLSVARPPTKAGKPSTEQEAAPAGSIKLDSADESAHPAFAVLAIITVLVGLALVYVLAATMSPAIPFPGRLV